MTTFSTIDTYYSPKIGIIIPKSPAVKTQKNCVTPPLHRFVVPGDWPTRDRYDTNRRFSPAVTSDTGDAGSCGGAHRCAARKNTAPRSRPGNGSNGTVGGKHIPSKFCRKKFPGSKKLYLKGALKVVLSVAVIWKRNICLSEQLKIHWKPI